MKKIKINTEYIKLQQALKLAKAVNQGSEAKIVIQEGLVKVNGQVCTMRGKKLIGGDTVVFNDNEFQIVRE